MILIGSDNSNNTLMNSIVLSRAGYSVQTAQGLKSVIDSKSELNEVKLIILEFELLTQGTIEKLTDILDKIGTARSLVLSEFSAYELNKLIGDRANVFVHDTPFNNEELIELVNKLYPLKPQTVKK